MLPWQMPQPTPPQQYGRPLEHITLSAGKNNILKIFLFTGGGVLLLAMIIVSLVLILGLLNGSLYKDRLKELGFECDEMAFVETIEESANNDAFKSDEEKALDEKAENSSLADHKTLNREHKDDNYEITVYSVAD